MIDPEPFLLWVPVNQESPEETDDLIEKATLANNGILDFCDGIITLDDTFEIIEQCGADVDSYRENLTNIVKPFGA